MSIIALKSKSKSDTYSSLANASASFFEIRLLEQIETAGNGIFLIGYMVSWRVVTNGFEVKFSHIVDVKNNRASASKMWINSHMVLKNIYEQI